MSKVWPALTVYFRTFLFFAWPFGLSFLTVQAQVTSTITDLVVVKKPNHPDGAAMATVRGPATVKGKVTITEKKGRIASHALQAWTIRGGQAALLLMSPAKKGEKNRLRYYDLDADKGRFLGNVPFANATMMESEEAKGLWAFAVTGLDTTTNRPVIFVGDATALHGRIEGGSVPKFIGSALSFQSASGPKSVDTAIGCSLG